MTANNEETPTTSVIVPVYNDPEGLETTVESLLNQSVDDYEIIIADNGSTDRTIDIARNYASHDQVTLVVEDDIQTSYAARNAGIGCSEGEILGFLDANMWVEENYIESITHAVKEDNSPYIGCNVKLIADGSSTARFNAVTGFHIKEFIESKNFAPTCCLAVHKAVIEEVGRFDQHMISSGDVEFGRRVKRNGFEQRFAPLITVYHPARSSVRELIYKAYRIGRGKVQINQRHPHYFDSRPLYHPRNFLPVSPFTFPHLVQDEATNFLEYLYWYILSYTQKLAKTGGGITERLLFG